MNRTLLKLLYCAIPLVLVSCIKPSSLDEYRHLDEKLASYDVLQIVVKSSASDGGQYVNLFRGMLTNRVNEARLFRAVVWEDRLPPAQSNVLRLNLDLTSIDRGPLADKLNFVAPVDFHCNGELVQTTSNKVLAGFEAIGRAQPIQEATPAAAKEQESQSEVVQRAMALAIDQIADYLARNK
jgi:hypothetical protein